MADKFEITRVGSLEIDEPIKFTERDIKALPVGFISIYRQSGWKNLLAAKAEAALRNFHLSAAADHTDRKTLIGRSHARCRTMRFPGALQDAETILKENEYDKDAIFLQALCEYELGNFEEGLVMFHRGINKRGVRREFREGRDQVHNTIENCIGRHGGPALTDLQCAIHDMELTKLNDQKSRERMVRYCAEDLDIKPKFNCSEEAWNRWQQLLKKREFRMAQLYLGKLSEDREWCQNLLENTNVNSRNKVSTDRILAHGNKGLNDLDTRFQILMSRKPFYHYAFKALNCQHLVSKNKETTAKNMKLVMDKVLKNFFDSLKNHQNRKETFECIKLSYRIKKLVGSTPKNYLPATKKALFQDISLIMAVVYLNLKINRPNLSKTQNRKRLQYIIGMDREYNDLNIDPIIQETDFPFWNCTSALASISEFLAIAESDLEKAWLHHERSYLYMRMNKWGHMTAEANKCVAYATSCESHEWAVNGLFLVFLGEIRRKDRTEARDAIAECLKIAKNLENESLIEFLSLAKDIEEEREEVTAIVDSNTIIRKREETIIGLMSDLTKKEHFRDLFTRMRFLPPERRMSVVPGFRHMPVPGQRFTTKSIIPGGSGGRLGFNAITNRSYLEFLDID